jgi:hypothetical protein
VLWLDSDTRLTEDKTYLKVTICNMEHRDANYAGVFPFKRCFNHEESLYTKPEVFERMGLDAEKFLEAEQYLLDRLVFTSSTRILSEWEQWGRIPVMFGNDGDFPSKTPPSDDYIPHKNDQSIFSLTVRLRGMKAWPGPFIPEARLGGEISLLAKLRRCGQLFIFRSCEKERVCPGATGL